MVSCEIVDSGKYDMIIPFVWWLHEHPIRNIEALGDSVSNTPNMWNMYKQKVSLTCWNVTRRWFSMKRPES